MGHVRPPPRTARSSRRIRSLNVRGRLLSCGPEPRLAGRIKRYPPQGSGRGPGVGPRENTCAATRPGVLPSVLCPPGRGPGRNGRPLIAAPLAHALSISFFRSEHWRGVPSPTALPFRRPSGSVGNALTPPTGPRPPRVLRLQSLDADEMGPSRGYGTDPRGTSPPWPPSRDSRTGEIQEPFG